jgi:hypothetical protein
MTIHEFLELPHRFRWGGMGGDDCMTFAASWVAQSHGVDPAERLRGTYATRDEAHAIMAAYGGGMAFMAAHLGPLGATRVQQLHDGDIGLVSMLAGESPADVKMALVGAIRFGPMWASISPGGVVARRAEHVAAWRLPA